MCCETQVALPRASLMMCGEMTQVSARRKLSPGRLRLVGVVLRLELENVPKGSSRLLASCSQRPYSECLSLMR